MMGFCLVGAGFLIGIIVLKPLAAFIQQEFNFAFGMAKYGLLGSGVGGVATLFVSRETRWYIVIPFLVGIVVFLLISIMN
jgi:hypothetical protein